MEEMAKDAATVTDGTPMSADEAAQAAEKKKKASEAEAQKAMDEAGTLPAAAPASVDTTQQ